ncbi:MAG TPA: M28 family peptidase [Pyrinomonadaceae bacterium]
MKFKASLSLLILVVLSVELFAQPPQIKISTPEEIKAELEITPCKSRKERREALKQLFLKMGAPESDIAFEKIDDVENVVLTKKGKTDKTILIGAHFDKTENGCGVIDNWSGIVILAHIYRTMRNLTTDKTYKFVGFDKEELGLLGSEAMAKQIPKEKRDDYCAMVNFDSFGFSYPQAMRNISTGALVNLAKEVSDEMKIPFAQAAIQFASSDSESFRVRGIPAISLHGLDNQWQNYLHTANDKISKVNIQSVFFGYRHGLVFLSKLEAGPCDAFREDKKEKKK